MKPHGKEKKGKGSAIVGGKTSQEIPCQDKTSFCDCMPALALCCCLFVVVYIIRRKSFFFFLLLSLCVLLLSLVLVEHLFAWAAARLFAHIVLYVWLLADHAACSLTFSKFRHQEGRWTLMRRAPFVCHLEPRNTTALSMQLECRMFVNYPHLASGPLHAVFQKPLAPLALLIQEAGESTLSCSQTGLKYSKLSHATNLYFCVCLCVLFLNRMSPESTTLWSRCC